MAPKASDLKIASLVVRLRDNENMTYEDIAKHMKMTKSGVFKMYQRTKNSYPINKGGRPRKTDIR